jgi:nucleoside-diphosphate-sugar epimerase
VLGWEPNVPLHEGIVRTIPFFRGELEKGDARARTI